MTRRISVLHVVLSTATGGMENVIYSLASSHDRSRVELQVVCLEAIGPLSQKLEQQGVSSLLLPRMVPGLSLAYPRRLIRQIRRSACDVVHTHSGCWTKVAAACAWVPGLKLVYTEHGRAYPDAQVRVAADRFAARFTDRVVAVGEPLREYLVGRIGLPASKVLTIRNGVDTQRFKPSSGIRSVVRAELGYSPADVVVVIVARLAKVKNHGLLLQAFHDVTAKCPRARLLIIGDGPLRGDLEEIVRCLALTERVRFAGDRPDVERLLTGADMATLSSSSEGTSLSLLEAMATGLPVVATRVGGNPDIVVDGHNGVLVGQDRADYAAALVALIESEAMRRALGENARETVIREWSAARMARQYEAVYTELGT